MGRKKREKKLLRVHASICLKSIHARTPTTMFCWHRRKVVLCVCKLLERKGEKLSSFEQPWRILQTISSRICIHIWYNGNLSRIILKLNVISFQLEIFIETGIISVKISSVFVVSSTKLYAQYAKRDYWKTFIRSSSTFIFTSSIGLRYIVNNNNKEREREKIDASIKINKNPLTRLSIQTFITYETDFDDTICCNEKFPPLHIFFLSWQTSPFTLPDNLTICKIASPPGLIPDLTSHGDLVSSRWRMLRQSFFSVKQAFEILSFLIVN